MYYERCANTQRHKGNRPINKLLQRLKITMQHIKLAIEQKRDYMRKPQNWLNVASDESITTIESKSKTYHVKISPEDFEKVGKYRWYITQNGYAITSIKYKRTRMHHLIMGKPPKGKQTDHIDRNRLNNKRSNLRFVSSLQNGQNSTGVGIRQRGNSWEGNLCFNYRKYFKGGFKTKDEAMEWRDFTKKKLQEALWI